MVLTFLCAKFTFVDFGVIGEMLIVLLDVGFAVLFLRPRLLSLTGVLLAIGVLFKLVSITKLTGVSRSRC